MTGVERIAASQRQIEEEGYDAAHDDAEKQDALCRAAACYALPRGWMPVGSVWPWRGNQWKPTPDDRIRELEKAGALIAPEIDRLLRSRPS